MQGYIEFHFNARRYRLEEVVESVEFDEAGSSYVYCHCGICEGRGNDDEYVD